MAHVQSPIYNHSQLQPPERRSSGTAGNIAPGARRHAADDLLKQPFYPLFGGTLPRAACMAGIERSFFRSVRHLRRAYTLHTTPVRYLPFPVNIHATFQQLRDELQAANDAVRLFITGTVRRPIVATLTTMLMNHELYYIPLAPLWHLLRQRQTSTIGHLLLSAYSRLHTLGVSLCNSGTFIGYEMDMIRDGSAANEAGDDDRACQEALDEARFIVAACNTLCRKISDRRQALAFERRLEKISARDDWEKQLITVLKRIRDVALQHPHRSFHDQIVNSDVHETGEQQVYPEQYLTFYWGGEGTFDHQLAEWIDVYLQEASSVAAPAVIQCFDHPHEIVSASFVFEQQLLQAITELNQLLYARTNT